MTTLATGAHLHRGTGRTAAARLVKVVGILCLLALAIDARRTAVLAGMDGLVVGVAFGAVLVAIALAGGWRPGLPRAGSVGRSATVGSAAAVALIAIAVIGRARGSWVPLDPAATFLPWAQVTILVATAEELVLRGVLFDAAEDAVGPVAAVALTAAAFALLHVPLYGWAVVPLDCGVGILLGGLRLVTGGVTAPAFAHVVADLAAWWL
jgi:membrane protease YdiL (CAAX protease family)